MYLLEVPRLPRAWKGDATAMWWLSAAVLVWRKHELTDVSGVKHFRFQIFLNNSQSGYTYFEQLLFSVKIIFRRNIWANIAVPRLIPCDLCLENTEIVFIWYSVTWQTLEKARVLYSTAWFHVCFSWKLLAIENQHKMKGWGNDCFQSKAMQLLPNGFGFFCLSRIWTPLVSDTWEEIETTRLDIIRTCNI